MDGGTKVCSNDPGHMTKMATMPIIFSGTNGSMTLKLGIQHWGLRSYKICSNGDPELTLTYFMGRSTLIPNAFIWETT